MIGREIDNGDLLSGEMVGIGIEVLVSDIEDGRRAIQMYGRKDGDRARRNRAVKNGKVDHADKKAAKNLVKQNDAESWQLYQKGVAGSNPDIILDESTGEIILRPVIPGGKRIKTNVKPIDVDKDLYERLRHAEFIAEVSPLLAILDSLLIEEPGRQMILRAVHEGLEAVWDRKSGRMIREVTIDGGLGRVEIEIQRRELGVVVAVMLPPAEADESDLLPQDD